MAGIAVRRTASLSLAYVPAIHVFIDRDQDVDARDKRGHDAEVGETFPMTTDSLDGSIHDGKHVMQVRVYYEDTDFSDPPLL